jgi:hypothetical protein
VYFQHTLTCSRPSFSDRITGVSSFTLVAVGAGVAAMVQTLHHLLPLVCPSALPDHDAAADGNAAPMARITLVYGNRHVQDILLRELLESWAQQYRSCFKMVYVIGSRYANVHQQNCAPPTRTGRVRAIAGYGVHQKRERLGVGGHFDQTRLPTRSRQQGTPQFSVG